MRPNKGLQYAYQARLDRLISAMQRDIMENVPAAYKETPPEMAMDASPARTLDALMKRLAAKWELRFSKAAPELATWFATAADKRSTVDLKMILKRAGISVKFTMSREVNDIVQAAVAENVELIKSIPAQHFTQIQGDVMRSVQVGRDLGPLALKLEYQYGVTKRRASFIALDQSNKATATIGRARQLQAGITEAIWLHSGRPKKPRPSHKAFNGHRYNIAEGALIDGERIWPGWKPRCGCVAKPIIAGLS